MVIDIVVCGLDVDYLIYVINYDLFDSVDSYVYCIGCIGCVGWEGIVIFLINFVDKWKLWLIECYLC